MAIFRDMTHAGQGCHGGGEGAEITGLGDTAAIGGTAAEAAARLLADDPPRAASFIVTIYGDVVEPRGGVLWMGTLIELCAEVGISETLVRTAMSRLVAAGQVTGEREGRRSYYRLTGPARAEFAAAAEVLFGPVRAATGWRMVADAPPAAAEALRRAGFAALSAELMLGPDRPLPPLAAPAIVFAVDPLAGQAGRAGDLPAFAARHWDLDHHATAYRQFVTRFTPLAQALAGGGALAPRACLVARLLMVHQYRAVLLRDPRLPLAALPPDWPAEAAARLFAGLYSALSPAADSHVGERFVDAAGPLPDQTLATRARLASLLEPPQAV